MHVNRRGEVRGAALVGWGLGARGSLRLACRGIACPCARDSLARMAVEKDRAPCVGVAALRPPGRDTRVHNMHAGTPHVHVPRVPYITTSTVPATLQDASSDGAAGNTHGECAPRSPMDTHLVPNLHQLWCGLMQRVWLCCNEFLRRDLLGIALRSMWRR
eukprot:350689-Chlamydomonas_euryale.AAC.8